MLLGLRSEQLGYMLETGGILGTHFHLSTKASLPDDSPLRNSSTSLSFGHAVLNLKGKKDHCSTSFPSHR
jgi:hypothetical protein